MLAPAQDPRHRVAATASRVRPVAVAILIAVIALGLRSRRDAKLRGTFGSEYDRTVDDSGSKRAAVNELNQRKARHDELEITPLDIAVAQRLRDEWRLVQERFVD